MSKLHNDFRYIMVPDPNSSNFNSGMIDQKPSKSKVLGLSKCNSGLLHSQNQRSYNCE